MTPCFLVQDRDTFQFVTVDADGVFCLQPSVRFAKRFSDGEEAGLAGFELCSEGFYLFTCYLEDCNG